MGEEVAVLTRCGSATVWPAARACAVAAAAQGWQKSFGPVGSSGLGRFFDEVHWLRGGPGTKPRQRFSGGSTIGSGARPRASRLRAATAVRAWWHCMQTTVFMFGSISPSGSL